MSHFNQAANLWDSPEKFELNKKYADEIKKITQKNHFKKVLEVGCGTGLLGANFLESDNIYIGVDTSEGMLKVFDDKFKEAKNAQSLLINLEQQDFPEKNFDLIISSMAFHHLVNPESMLKKLKEKLSPDGVIAVIDLDEEDGTFHPDPAKMGVHHFGFSEEKAKLWGNVAGLQLKRKIVHVNHKNEKDYPIFLAVFSR